MSRKKKLGPHTIRSRLLAQRRRKKGPAYVITRKLKRIERLRKRGMEGMADRVLEEMKS